MCFALALLFAIVCAQPVEAQTPSLNGHFEIRAEYTLRPSVSGWNIGKLLFTTSGSIVNGRVVLTNTQLDGTLSEYGGPDCPAHAATFRRSLNGDQDLRVFPFVEPSGQSALLNYQFLYDWNFTCSRIDGGTRSAGEATGVCYPQYQPTVCLEPLVLSAVAPGEFVFSGTLQSWPDRSYGTAGVTARIQARLTLGVPQPDLAIAQFTKPQSLRKLSDSLTSVASVANLGGARSIPSELEVQLEDPFTGQWVSIGKRPVSALANGETESAVLPIDISVPNYFAISIYKRAATGETGTYGLRVCVRATPGETNTANNCQITTGRDVTLHSACTVVTPLDPVTDAEALELENAELFGAPFPTRFLNAPKVDSRLASAVNDLVTSMNLFCKRGTTCVHKSSGYRPTAYQEHFYAGNIALTKLYWSSSQACDDFEAALKEHFERKHQIVKNPNPSPATHGTTNNPYYFLLNPPNTTGHEYGLAIDVSGRQSTSLSEAQIDEMASAVGLRRACRKDLVHFDLIGSPANPRCKVFWTDVHSPVNVLVTDPIGRRVGFDPATGSAVNEIGEGAYYSGPDSEPETVAIGDVLAGEYKTSAVGTGSGTYTIISQVAELEGEVLSTNVLTGAARTGASIEVPAIDVLNTLPAEPRLRLYLDGDAYRAGEQLQATADLDASANETPVDAYIVVQLPNGQFLSLQLDGSLVPGIIPLARQLVPFDYDGIVAKYTFSGVEPVGTYTWYTALTEPGTFNFVGPVRQVSFIVQ